MFLSDFVSLLVSRYRSAQVIPTHSSCLSSFIPCMVSLLSSFFIPDVTSSLSSFFIPSMASSLSYFFMCSLILSLSSSFMPGIASSLSSSFISSMACSIHSRLPSYAAVFRPVQYSLQHVRWSSVLPSSTVFAVVFHSVRCSMCGILPFCPRRHTCLCSVLTAAARYTRQSSVLPGVAYAAVFYSVWCGPVYMVAFHSVRHGLGCAVVL